MLLQERQILRKIKNSYFEFNSIVFKVNLDIDNFKNEL